MKTSIGKLVILFAIPLLCSCASIVSKTSWPVLIGSSPAGADISIINRKGQVVFEGVSPAALKLKSGAGFFKPESYQIRISKAGYTTYTLPLECKVNGWYAGNILIGGLIGLLIVDPATGAMYKLETDSVFGKLSLTTADTRPSIKILDIGGLTAEEKSQLVPIHQ